MKVNTAPDEISLVSLIHSGDEDAFASILELYEIPVQRYLYRLTGDYELARDLTQDTFIQAYRYILKSNLAISSLKAWLYGKGECNIIPSLYRYIAADNMLMISQE